MTKMKYTYLVTLYFEIYRCLYVNVKCSLLQLNPENSAAHDDVSLSPAY